MLKLYGFMNRLLHSGQMPENESAKYKNVKTRKACYIDIVQQKIRSLNAEAKTAEKILGLLKKNYVYLGLEKKNATALQDSLAGYIEVVCYCCFAFPTRIISILNKILNINKENITKSDKRVV